MQLTDEHYAAAVIIHECELAGTPVKEKWRSAAGNRLWALSVVSKADASAIESVSRPESRKRTRI